MKTHELLKLLYERSGYGSYEKLAKAMGYKYGSSIQRYFDEDGRKSEFFPLDLVRRFEAALVGQGNPPITSQEVMELGGVYAQKARATGGMADAPYKGHGSPYHAAAGNMSAVEEAADLLKLIGVASPEAKKTLEGWIKKGVLDEVPIEEVKESGYASPSPKAKKKRR